MAEPSTSFDTDLADLRDEADVLLQQAARAHARTTPTQGSDGSGQVVVDLSADGELRAVRVGFAWDRTLRADELPAAVLQAWANAQSLRMESWAAAYEDAEREPAPAARPADRAGSVTQELRQRVAAMGDGTDGAARVLEEVLGEVSQALEEANRLLEEHVGRSYAGRSGNHVWAEVSGAGDLTALRFDPAWLRLAHPGNLGRETTVAIRAAVTTAREHGIRAAMRAGRLAELADLAFPGADTTSEGTTR